MQNAETVLGLYLGFESLESRMRSKDSCPVWGGAVGKVPQGNSLAAYSTSCPVLRGLVSGNTHRLPGVG